MNVNTGCVLITYFRLSIMRSYLSFHGSSPRTNKDWQQEAIIAALKAMRLL